MINKHKIDHFYNDKVMGKFPKYKEVEFDLAVNIRERVATHLGLPVDSSGLAVISKLAERYAECEVGKQTESIGMINMMRDNDVAPKSKIYINWYRFDDITEMEFNDLIQFFEYIWYPQVDIIDVFDGTMSWFIQVSESGEVCCWIPDRT